MDHMTSKAAPILGRGRKMAGVLRDPLVVAIVHWAPGSCRNEIAEEYEYITGEWLGTSSLYTNLRRLRTQGQIRLQPRGSYGDRRVKCYEVTPRGDRTLDQLRRIMKGTIGRALRLVG